MGKRTQGNSLTRRQYVREPYDKVLIVCEGEKTEPNYFKGLKNHLRLKTANVAIVGEGATPAKIVERAKELEKQEKERGDPFDTIFCVFDKDRHTDYEKALGQLKARKNYEAIPSVPAFEYWLLLHFRYTTSPYQDASELVRDLKKHLPDYEKNDATIFGKLQDKLETAKENAARSLEDRSQAKTDNPSTKVHILVEALQGIKQP
ncbi:MAG: RloB family protein [Nitrospira sp.]|nr:RloB family protein [Nitrospira sp.]